MRLRQQLCMVHRRFLARHALPLPASRCLRTFERESVAMARCWAAWVAYSVHLPLKHLLFVEADASYMRKALAVLFLLASSCVSGCCTSGTVARSLLYQ